MFWLNPTSVPCREDHDDHLNHAKITERFRKTLYFGKTPKLERPSLPLTELAVEFCQDAAKRELGRIDTDLAASMGRQACMSPCSMVLGMLYIERLKKKNPSYLRKVCSSDLFLISMMMASKYSYDEGVDDEVFNDEWAESANMDTEEVNNLEMDFLSAMDWGLFVHPEEFKSSMEAVEKRIALQQGLDRNWFSYTDLLILFQDPKYGRLWDEIRTEVTKALLTCSLAYFAGFVTMISSVMALSYVSVGVSMVTPIVLYLQPQSTGEMLLPQGSLLPVFDNVTDSRIQNGHFLSQNDVSSAESNSLQTSPTFSSTASYSELDVEDTISGLNTSRQSVPVEREKSQFKSAFRPFFAVMTLKNALISFVSAVNSADEPGVDNSFSSRLTPLGCVTGNCPSSVKSSCFNVTVPKSLNLNPESNRKYGAKSCCTQCRRNLAPYSRNTYVSCKTNFVSNSATSSVSEFHCCCQVRSQPAVDPWVIQMDPFPDITHGFQTRTLSPLLAKT